MWNHNIDTFVENAKRTTWTAGKRTSWETSTIQGSHQEPAGVCTWRTSPQGKGFQRKKGNALFGSSKFIFFTFTDRLSVSQLLKFFELLCAISLLAFSNLLRYWKVKLMTVYFFAIFIFLLSETDLKQTIARFFFLFWNFYVTFPNLAGVIMFQYT